MNPAALGRELENRTVKHLRERGFTAERVSRTGLRVGGDLFGAVDVIAIDAAGVELIQVTTRTNRSARRRKIQAAALPRPVRLWWWWKQDNGRWTYASEMIPPAPEATT